MPHGFVPDSDEPRWRLKALREAAHELESQLWEADVQDQRRRIADDAWSLAEIAAHIRDREQHFLRSLELIFAWDAARIPHFDGEALAMERDGQQLDMYEALDRYTYLRHASVNLLWSADADAWEKTGIHPYLGPVSVRRLAREQNEHDLEHLWQVRQLRETLASSAPATP